MQDGYLKTSEFCSTCHDVRTPPDARLADAVDPVTNEPSSGWNTCLRNGKMAPTDGSGSGRYYAV